MNAREHILTRLTVAHPLRQAPPMPDGWEFDSQVGAWTDPHTGRFMVHDVDSPNCGTKKNDLETGEDAKGQ